MRNKLVLNNQRDAGSNPISATEVLCDLGHMGRPLQASVSLLRKKMGPCHVGLP